MFYSRYQDWEYGVPQGRLAWNEFERFVVFNTIRFKVELKDLLLSKKSLDQNSELISISIFL